jgi:hypothetical protein
VGTLPKNRHALLIASTAYRDHAFRHLAAPGADTEMLAAGRRSFLKGSLIAPLTPNIQFTVTALRGSLPPDFRVLGNTVVIGLTFTNPGSSEH